MGKKDTEKVLQMVIEFLGELSNKQFQNLINGSAVIRYEEKSIGNNEKFKEMKKKFATIAGKNNMETHIKRYKKQELVSFCNHFSIPIKSKDTKRMIFEKIILHLKLDVSSKQPVGDKEDKWKEIEMELHKMNTLEEAEYYISNHKQFKTKKDMIAFARAMDIYVTQRHTKQELRDRIVASLVGARIRGEMIRG